MKVAWDARPLCAKQLRGIGHYSEHLLRELRRLPNIDVALFHDSEYPDSRPCRDASQRIGPTIGYRWQLWERLGLPWHAYVGKYDLIHSLANTTPPYSLVPTVVTVHDVIPFLPHVAERDKTLRYLTSSMPSAVRRARLVLTDSEHSRRDIVEHLQVPPDRVQVIPLAVAPDLTAPSGAALSHALRDLGAIRPYVLALGASARRKNVDGVLRVFKRVIPEHRHIRLILTGIDGALDDAIRRGLSALDIPSDRVVRLPFVDDLSLAALYAGAEAFLFLSLYEGFGIPILEAFRCGVPVVCSDKSSCPEVAGDAAALVDPLDEASTANVVLSILNETLDQRHARVQRGLARERLFSWRRTASLTLDAYRQAVSG